MHKTDRVALTCETRPLRAAGLSTTSTCTHVTAIGGKEPLSYPILSTVILTA